MLLDGDLNWFSSGVDDRLGGKDASTFLASSLPIFANRFSKLLKKWVGELKLIGSMPLFLLELEFDDILGSNGDDNRRRGEESTSSWLRICSRRISCSRLVTVATGTAVFLTIIDLRRRLVRGFRFKLSLRVSCRLGCGELEMGLLIERKFFSSNVAVIGIEFFLAAAAVAAAAFFWCWISLSIFESRYERRRLVKFEININFYQCKNNDDIICFITSLVKSPMKHPFILFDGLNCKYLKSLTTSSFLMSSAVSCITDGVILKNKTKKNELIDESKTEFILVACVLVRINQRFSRDIELFNLLTD